MRNMNEYLRILLFIVVMAGISWQVARTTYWIVMQHWIVYFIINMFELSLYLLLLFLI